MLEVRDLHAGYGDAEVLFGIDLKVEPGEVVAIVGSNGAGKTTLLRALSGILKPSSGSIRFKGEEMIGRPAQDMVEHGLVMVPEGRRIFPRMSVRRNLEIGAFSRRARPHLAERLDYVTRLFPILKERADQLGGTLSGGQQQMCAIARGLVATPEVLMLDEVSLGLAPVMISRVYDAIRSIGDLGVTLLIVEQNVTQALSVADRAYVIQQGRVALTGTGRQLQGNEEVQRIYLGLNSTEEQRK